VRGVPYEVPLAPRSAVGQMDRFWEAHDLIVKALSTRDGPFDWQGEHFQFRNVNVWPQCWQQPHPPVWITGRARINVREIAERNYVLASFLSGYDTRGIFDHYRDYCAEAGRPAPRPDRFAYLGFVAVAATREKAMKRAELITSYLKTNSLVADPFKTPPGYFSTPDVVRQLKASGRRLTVNRDGRSIDIFGGSLQDLIDGGILFAGTPDDVYRQMATFRDSIGGLGHFLAMAHAGHMSHEDTVDNLTLIAKEVLPRLKEDAAAAGRQAA
jgi:alkanesulfonate monooxygenase SsuD/methylene tetrahydromethanopterin reductase-like flavin-dependent oxidoreductase (luciferase family)